MPNTKMTDHQLKELYFQIGTHYEDCTKRGLTLAQINYELYTSLRRSLDTFELRQLEPYEREKAFIILETFLSACPQYTVEPPANPATFFMRGVEDMPIPHGVSRLEYRTRIYYRNDNDLLITWLMLDNLNRPYYRRGYYDHGHDAHFHPGSSSGSGNRPNKDSKSSTNQAWAILAVLAIAATTLILAAFAVYYLWSQLARSFERFLYNEGWLQATVSIMGAAAGGVAAAMLTNIFLSGALASLALVAGISPVGLIVGVLICLTLVGAATGLLITNLVQDKCITSMNQDALDPENPYLFTLTDSEAARLAARNIDPVKVKCAILAIRARMGEPDSRSNWDRFFDNRTTAYQDGLDQIRRLRRGVDELGSEDPMTDVVVGNMHFYCKYGPKPVQGYVSSAADVGVQPPGYYDHLLSSPPGLPYTAVDQDRQLPPPAYGTQPGMLFSPPPVVDGREIQPTAPPGEGYW